MTAAQHAIAEGDYKLAAQRLIYARDAEPDEHVGPAAHDARVLAGGGPDRPPGARSATGPASTPTAPRRTASPRASTRTWARSTSPPRRPSAPRRARPRTPTPGSASAACGCGSWTAPPRSTALERARALGPSVEALLDLALAYHLAGDLGAEVTACEQATHLDPKSQAAWSRHAHALARTDRVSAAIGAAERALSLNGHDAELADLLARLRDAEPRVLPAA